jgi:aminobenzoyl-glutamate utilization protein B
MDLLWVSTIGVAVALAAPQAASALDDAFARRLVQSIEARGPRHAQVAHDIWGFAELGYLETRSSARLQAELRTAGFEVTAGVAGIPTAFVAREGVTYTPRIGDRPPALDYRK